MSLDAYLAFRPNPSRREITEVIGGHLCRCTGYAPIIEAALEAAAELRGDIPARIPGGRPCLISAPASLRASPAIPAPWPSSMGRPADLRGVVRGHLRNRGGLERLGLKPGDHLVTVLQNRHEAATLHWACQFAGIVITPINWRAKAEEIDFAIEKRASPRHRLRAGLGREPARDSAASQRIPRIAVGTPPGPGETAFTDLAATEGPPATPRADAEAISLMLYTSGTTAKPKGVPRRHGRSGQRRWPTWRRISTGAASGRSASCRSTTRWGCARFWRCR